MGVVDASQCHHYELLNAVVLESLMTAKSVESPDFRTRCDLLQAGFDLHVDFYFLDATSRHSIATH